MTRRQRLHAAALFLTLLMTVPGLALLCRGHAPSRFSSANLPFWERALPRPAPWRILLRGVPATPGDAQFPALAARLANADPGVLFSALEHPSDSPSSPGNAGLAGLWLQSACVLGRSDGRLRPAQDLIATRLMNAQDQDGYLAAGTKANRWSAGQISAYRENVRGLLAYYAITHSPAAIYAAMQAGDLVTTSFPTPTNALASDGLLLPMVQIAHWTGESKYRDWAIQQADAGSTDGPGLCALYQDTGRTPYLRAAKTLWQMEVSAARPDPALAAALWTITGAPDYVPALRSAAAPWISPLGPGSVAYGQMPGGLAVNVSAPSRVTLGVVHITQRLSPPSGKSRLATFTIDTTHPVLLTLKLPVSTASKPHQTIGYILNGKPTRGTPSGPWLALKRRWKAGDQISLAAPAPTAAPS